MGRGSERACIHTKVATKGIKRGEFHGWQKVDASLTAFQESCTANEKQTALFGVLRQEDILAAVSSEFASQQRRFSCPAVPLSSI